LPQQGFISLQENLLDAFGCKNMLFATKFPTQHLHSCSPKKTPSQLQAKRLILLVAGAGFEPTTFGL
jgi:predicted TIM-barrel fold metal-dependent hydrolase